MTLGPLRFHLSKEAKSNGVRFAAPREGDAGFDVCAAAEVVIEPRRAALIATGLFLEIPQGWVGIVRDRSSIALRGGAVTAGVIDSSYRGEVKIVMHNFADEPLRFRPGERIAQMVIVEHHTGDSCIEVEELEDLRATARGAGGFGSTGS